VRKLYTGIVRHPVLIIILFILTLIATMVCQPLIDVNYDINDYLPSDTASTVALDTMQVEYEGGIPNTRVMMKNVSISEALIYKAKLGAIDGVTDVTWLDDAADVTQPEKFIAQDALDTYYKDGNALFSVTIEEKDYIPACESIRALIGDDNCMSGTAVSTALATSSTVSEIPKIAAIGIAFAFLVLLLTNASWVEPILVLAGLGVAVGINAGSNIIFGEISFITNAAGSILQLAVSLDYSVFLLHRFEEYHAEIEDPKEAMIRALCSSTSSILSSGLTTVIGFLALCLMRFGIGPDLGVALAKGVALSLITVFLFMPCLILLTYRLIDKTRHRPLIPSMKGFGKLVYYIMIPMTLIFALIIVPSYRASNNNDFYYGGEYIFGEKTQLGRDTREIESIFGKSDTYVLMVPKTDTALQSSLSDALHTLPEIKSILSYVDTVGAEIPEQYLDSSTLSKLNSEHYTRMVLTVAVNTEGKEAFTLVKNVRDISEKYYPGQWLLAGQGVSTYDLKETITADMAMVNFIAIAAVFVVLLLTMKSISLPVILVLGIETAIWVNLSVPYFTDNAIFYIAYLLISSIQLGATVDYAILFTDRYLEYRKTMDKKSAVRGIITNCTISVMTSASVLCVVGFLMAKISSHGLIAQFGNLLGRGTLCSLAIVLFALPGMLYLFDGLIRCTTIHANFLKKSKKKESRK